MLMNIYLKGHNRKYDVESMALLFFPGQKFNYDSDKAAYNSVKSTVRIYKGYVVARTVLRHLDKVECASERVKGIDDKAVQAAVKLSFYKAGTKLTGIRPPWGILTGIRPAKLAYELADGKNFEIAKEILENEYLVSPLKARLCCDVAKNRASLNLDNGMDQVSLYIAIPFCPSRCLYCSFISHSTEKMLKLLPEYVLLLCEELKQKAVLFDKLNLKLKTVYIGGGTPSILEAEQIDMLLNTIKENYNMNNIAEYTFEAGRPDTVTKEKLEAVKRGGVNRISINTQTLNDEILSNIGRRHTADDYFTAFEAAREVGFEVINTDLIAGLPGESYQSFKDSIDKVVSLSPENITVHTLCVKRASNLNLQGLAEYSAESIITSEQLEYTHHLMSENEYFPYYMYRQKNTVGNLENTGYSKKGHEGLYNIIMMDETHSVIGAGAGAVTKLVFNSNQHIERIFNPKYPYEYKDHFYDIINQRNRVIDFYDKKSKE